MYPSEKSLAEKQVSGFMDFVVKNQAEIAKASQIVPMTSAQLSAAQAELKRESPRPASPGQRPHGMEASAAASRGATSVFGERRPRRGEALIRGLLFAAAVVSILTTIGIVISLLEPAIEFFSDVPLKEFLFGDTWDPRISHQYGIWPLLNGTLLVTGIAILVAIPLGLGTAIYLAEYARPRVRRTVKPVIELLAGVPTIVFGYFALTFFTPKILQRLPRDPTRHLQRAGGRASSWASWSCRRSPRGRGRDELRAAVAARGRLRPRRVQAPGLDCGSCSRPRCRGSWRQSSSAFPGRSARR